MATKTLGIKFEVAGVKEAQAGLDNLRKNVRSTLNQNLKAVAKYQFDLKKIRTERSSDEFKLSYGDKELVRAWRIPPDPNSPIKKFLRRVSGIGSEVSQKTRIKRSKDEFKLSYGDKELVRAWRIPPDPNSPIKRFGRRVSGIGSEVSQKTRIKRSKDEFKLSYGDKELVRAWRIPPDPNSPIKKFLRRVSGIGSEVSQKQDVAQAQKVYNNSENKFKNPFKNNTTPTVSSVANSPYTIYVKQQASSIAKEIGKEILGEIIRNQVRNLFSSKKKESDETEGQGALYKKSVRIRFTPEAIKDLANIIHGDKNTVDFSSKNRNILRIKDKKKKLIGKLIEPLTSRIDYVTSGYFGSIGSHFGGQFAKGLDGVLQSELDISHERKGQIAGKTYAYFQNGKEENLTNKFAALRQVITDLNDETKNVDAAQIKSVIQAALGIPNALVDSLLTGFRRSSVEIESVRHVGANKANFNEKESLDNLSQYRHAVIATSGFAGEGGKQSRKQAQQLQEINNSEDTAIFSSDSPFTDVSFQATDGISAAAWGINALANTAGINLKGFNPDAIEMVNKVLAMREQNPEIEITLSGHSAGGFVVEEAQYLLELLEVENTRAVTIGTPNLKGGLKPQNIQRIFGANDPLSAIHDAAEYLDFVSEGTELDEISQGHFFDQYLASPAVREAIFKRNGGSKKNNKSSPSSPTNPSSNNKNEQSVSNRNRDFKPSPGERISLITGDLIVSILENEGNIAERAEIFRNIVTEGFNQIGEDLNGYALDFGETIRNLLNNGLPNPGDKFGIDLSINLDALGNNLEQLFKEVLLAPLNNAIAEYRRVALKAVAIPAAKKRRDEILALNRRRTGARVTEDTETLIMGVGGIGGTGGRGGAQVARVVSQELEEKENTLVISVANPNSDIPKDSNDREGSSNIPSEQEINVVGSIAKPRIRGYSPDSIEGVANALAAIERNPEIKIKIVGYSGGGEVAEEIVEMLRMLGHGDRIKGIGVASPQTVGNLNSNNYKRIISSGDPINETAQMFGNRESTDNTYINSHDLNDYRASAEFQRFLNGNPGELSGEDANNLLIQSEDFLRNYALGLDSQQKIDDKEEAITAIQLLQEFIPEAETDVAAVLESVMQNFIEFVDAIKPSNKYVVEQRKLLNEAVEFLGEEGTVEQARSMRDRVIRSSQDNRMAARADNEDNRQLEIIDRELAITIEQLNQFIRDNQSVSSSPNKDRKENLVKNYQTYLTKIRDRAKEKYSNKDKSNIIADFKTLDRSQKGKRITAFADLIKIRQRQYLEAINTGQTEIAVKLGEELLDTTELVRSLYSDFENSIEADDPLLKTIKGNRAYLTSVQTEIFSGQPNLTNRVRQGLPDSIGEQFDLAESGDEVASGLIESITESLLDITEAGEKIGEALSEGTNESLEIESPSKVFKRIGEFVVEGLRLGLLNIEDPIEEATETIEAESEEIESGIIPTIKSFISGISQSFPFINRFKGAIIGVGTAIMGAMGIGFAVSNLQDLAKESLATALAVESLNRSIIFVSRTPTQGIENLEFISATAKNLSVDLNTAKEAYAGFLGASKNTSIEGEQTERIFAAFAGASANRGLDAQSQGRLFTAIEQIISKRYLGAEEVRGQIGDVFAGFEGILSEALGVPSSQLSEMMSNRELGLDVLPKVAAVLEAQNAAAEGIQTAQMAQTKYNNALLEFKTLLGTILQPLQKLTFNFASVGVDKLTDNFKNLLEVCRNLGGVILVALIGNVNLLKVALVSIKRVLIVFGSVLKSLYRAKLVILSTLARLAIAYGLVAAAMATINNIIKLSKNHYSELNDDVEKLTKSMNRYQQAVKDANSETINSSQSGKLQLNEGWKLPDNKFGNFLELIAGGDRLNLDNLVRKRWNGLIDRADAYNSAASGGRATPIKGKILTEAERRQIDFQAGVGDLNLQTDLLLGDSAPAVLAAKKITELDRAIAEIQSKRLELMSGDKKGLEVSLATERKINSERDKQLKILTNYQASLQISVSSLSTQLETLETGFASGEFTESVYNSTKASLLNRLQAAKDKISDVNGILSELATNLSVFQKDLRNSGERLQNYVERRGLEAQSERTNIVEDGIELEKGASVIQLELNAATEQEILDYISEYEQSIAAANSRLASAELAEGHRLLNESARVNNLTLDSATIERLLGEDERSPAQKKALAQLKTIRELETQLAQYREQLAQNISSNRNAVIDFNRTISDYFFRINQQIKEARLEYDRLLSQIFYTDIKNRLRSAIAPGSNTFVNGIIDNIQSVIDQAQQVAEKVFGDSAAQLGFESESRTLATEMQDFIRQIGSAGDAVENFVNRLNGKAGSSHETYEDLSSEGSSVAKNALSWQGKHFKEGVRAMCAGFVRQVLKDSGVDVGVTKDPYDAGKQPYNGELMARSFFGSDVGTVFKDKNQAQAGDIIGFFDTYQYGQKPGAITHVGIYQGNDMMVDRSTSSAPVRNRSIDTFGKGNYIFVRPHQYQDDLKQISFKADETSHTTGSKVVEQTQKLLALKQKNLNITKLATEQEREALSIQVEQTIEANKRQAEEGRKENARNLLGLESKFADLGMTYDYQSAAAQSASALRQIEQQFLDADLDTANQIRNTEDAIATINKTIPVLDAEIAKLKEIGTPEALELVEVKESARSELIKSFFALNDTLEKILIIQSESAALEEKYTAFVTEQNKLKEHQENLNKRNLLLTQQATLAEQRGTIEMGRKVKKHAEDLRLYLRINELRQQYAPGEYLDSLIKGEERQSQVNSENINYDAQIQELDLEKQLLDRRAEILSKKSSLFSRFGGTNFGLEKQRRDIAIELENNRFQKELDGYQNEYKDRPEKLEELARAATELNSVNLQSIDNEFKTLGKTIEGFGISSAQGFFSNISTDLFDSTGQREKALLEERLRYAEELVQLENQYRDKPGELAHMKNRARELNEEKLDKISNEFNIFKRGVDLAKQALIEFVKQLAAAIAQAAAAKIIGAIIGGVAGGVGGGVGAVGNDYGSGAGYSAFVADEGWTVGDPVDNYNSGGRIKKRKVSDRFTNYLRHHVPGVARAWNAEGSGAQLGVFHTGEELISDKTGEAPAYRGLKQIFGVNPAQAIVDNFSNGGTIGEFDAEANILSGFDFSRPRIDLSAIDEGRGRSNASSSIKNITLQQTIYTDNADSFRLNEDQRNQDLLIRLQRGI